MKKKRELKNTFVFNVKSVSSEQEKNTSRKVRLTIQKTKEFSDRDFEENWEHICNVTIVTQGTE